MAFSPRARAIAAFISVAVIWGVASVVIKQTLIYFPPFTFLFFRFAIMIPVTLPWYIWYIKKHPIKRSEFLPLTLFGFVATTLHLSLVFLGFERTTAIDGNLLGTVAPMFIILLGIVLLKERVTRREAVGLTLVVIGSIVTVIQPLLEKSALALENMTGNSIILTASMIWALFVLFSKKNFRHFPPLLITLHGSIVAFITFLPLAIIENNFTFPNYQILSTNITALAGVSYMAFVSYILAYFLYEYGMSKIEISQGSVFTYLQPLVATPLAVLVLGEVITIPFLAGAALIAVGVVLSELR